MSDKRQSEPGVSVFDAESASVRRSHFEERLQKLLSHGQRLHDLHEHVCEGLPGRQGGQRNPGRAARPQFKVLHQRQHQGVCDQK